VLLGSPMQLELAVQKNRQHMGKRYVEVFPCRKLVRARPPPPGAPRGSAASGGWAAIRVLARPASVRTPGPAPLLLPTTRAPGSAFPPRAECFTLCLVCRRLARV